MKKHSLKERFEYWLEQETSKSVFGLVKFIAFIIIFSSLLISVLIVLTKAADETRWIRVFWDTITASVNAEIPMFVDYEETSYVLLIAISALIGLFVTSFLISILSSFLEEKLTKIREANSLVLENDHYIILGHAEGETTLVKELVVGAEGKKRTIVIADKMDVELVKEEIDNKIEYGKNIKIIYRNIDICNDSELKCLSIDTCKSIIISPINDVTVIRCLFALSSILNKLKREDTVVVAAIKDKKYILPQGFNNTKNLVLLVLNNFMSKIIANTCAHPGLSLAYVELFNNQGSEIYPINLKEATNKTFKELLCQMNDSVPIGVISEGKTIINPSVDYIVKENDKLIVFAENNYSIHLDSNLKVYDYIQKDFVNNTERINVLMIGSICSYKGVIDEMKHHDTNISFICFDEEELEELNELISNNKHMSSILLPEAKENIYVLKDILKDFDRVVLLNNRELDREVSDAEVMIRYENLKYIKEENNFDYKMCVELRIDNNRKLIKGKSNENDFIVRSNMFSMFLSQLSNNPELIDMYRELLSKGNNEILLLPKSLFNIDGEKTVSEIRMLVRDYGYIFLGYYRNKGKRYQCHYNSNASDIIDLNEKDVLLVIGEDGSIY